MADKRSIEEVPREITVYVVSAVQIRGMWFWDLDAFSQKLHSYLWLISLISCSAPMCKQRLLVYTYVSMWIPYAYILPCTILLDWSWGSMCIIDMLHDTNALIQVPPNIHFVVITKREIWCIICLHKSYNTPVTPTQIYSLFTAHPCTAMAEKTMLVVENANHGFFSNFYWQCHI